MRQWLVGGALAASFAAGCVAPPAPLAPERLVVRGQSPADVLRGVVARAATAGWVPVVSDVAGGTVVLRRELPGADMRGALTCTWQPGSMDESNGLATVTLTVQGTAMPEGTALTAATRVSVAFPGLTGVLARVPTETACASTGRLEDAVLGPLRPVALPRRTP